MISVRSKLILSIGVLVGLSMYSARPVWAVDMREVLNAARINDPAFRAAAAERNAGKLNEKIGRSLLLPSVIASYSEGRAKYDREFTGNTNTTSQLSDVDLKSYSVQLRQPVYSLDAKARYDLGKESAVEADYVYRFNEFDLVQRTATLYIDVLVAIEQLNAASAQREALAEALKLSIQQKAGGETSRLDVLDVTAKFDLAKAQFLEAQFDLETKIRSLEGLTGLVVADIAGVDEGYIPSLETDSGFDSFRRLMLTSNPEILVAKSRIEQAKIQKRRAFAGHTPRLDFVAVKSFSENDTVNTINQVTDSETVQLQMQLPLFSGFGTTAQVDQAEERLRQEKANLDDLVLQKEIELRKAFSQSLLNRDKTNAYRQAVLSAEEAVKAAQLGQKAGVRIRLDELTALQQLYQTRKDYLRTKFESMVNLVKLNLLTGSSSIDEISVLFDVFDSKSNSIRLPRLVDERLSAGDNTSSVPDEATLQLRPLN